MDHIYNIAKFLHVIGFAFMDVVRLFVHTDNLNITPIVRDVLIVTLVVCTAMGA